MPGYKAGTCLSNVSGGGSCTGWEVVDGVASAASSAAKLLQVARNGITVIGHYPGYVQLGEEIGGNVFQVSTQVWKSLNTAQRWAANKEFLNQAIARGDTFILATEIKAGMSYFRAETQYLLKNGYQYGTSNGMKALIKP